MKYLELNLSPSQLCWIKIGIKFRIVVIMLFLFWILSIFATLLVLSTYNIESFYFFKKYTIEKEGKVYEVQDASWPAGESTRTYHYQYQYNGEVVKSYAYGDKDLYKTDDIVSILVDEGDYKYSIAPGLNKSEGPLWGFFLVLLFPILCAVPLRSVIEESPKLYQIIDNGVLTDGWHTRTEIYDSDEDTSYDHYYKYSDKSGKFYEISMSKSKEKAIENVNIIFNRTAPSESFICEDNHIWGLKRIRRRISRNQKLI